MMGERSKIDVIICIEFQYLFCKTDWVVSFFIIIIQARLYCREIFVLICDCDLIVFLRILILIFLIFFHLWGGGLGSNAAAGVFDVVPAVDVIGAVVPAAVVVDDGTLHFFFRKEIRGSVGFIALSHFRFYGIAHLEYILIRTYSIQ